MPPNLKQFDEEIQRYKAMEKAMKGLRTTRDIGWTRVDAKPLKKSLESLVAKWSYLYVTYLQVSAQLSRSLVPDTCCTQCPCCAAAEIPGTLKGTMAFHAVSRAG